MIRQVHHPRLNPDLRRLAHFFCTEGVYAAAVFRIEGRADAVVLAEAVVVHQRAAPGVSRISVVVNFSGDLSTLLPLRHSTVKASLHMWANDLVAEWTQFLARHGDTIVPSRAIEYDGLRMYQRDPQVELPALVPFPQGAAERIPPSQQQYLDPWTALDPAFFRYPTAEQFAAIREEEEEEESTWSDEGENAREEGGDSDKVLGEEDETPEEGSYSEHSEGEQSEEEEEDEEGEEEHEERPAGSEWEVVPEEALRTGTEAEDPEAARKREEITAGKKELELASAASLHIHDDPNRDPEPSRLEDGDLAATTPTPSAWRRSRSPSSPTRPPVRRRTDTGDWPSSPITLPPSP
ncbi:hypothetical protein CBR_g16063 [Chara braunii]|uniref:Uncharacterized protein n=1 Tax=Chara braunii TaxID=69332 RepID=A0A388JT23_CHABU|nr:hypothetical protein CBR_g16063 [Chara braunii]|eukprot:GBG60941.1 hypothetical protein CBR_g16063 [Chara braunii]